MFDTVNLRITRGEVAGVDFLSEIPCYLDSDSISVHTFSDGEAITGTLGNLKVSLNAYQVKVRDGSLCKWFLGDNFQTMGRKDTMRAIEKLSDTLHLPMERPGYGFHCQPSWVMYSETSAFSIATLQSARGSDSFL